MKLTIILLMGVCIFSFSVSATISEPDARGRVSYEIEEEIIIETEFTEDFIYNRIKPWAYGIFRDQRAGSSQAETALNIISFLAGGGATGYSSEHLNKMEIIEENPSEKRFMFTINNGILRQFPSGYRYNTYDFTCRIDVRDNRFRFRFFNVDIKDWAMSMNGQNINERVLRRVDKELVLELKESFQFFANDFKEYLSAEDEDDDW